jgi:4a-hydroxytetrahydrobiopterin dehydratase
MAVSELAKKKCIPCSGETPKLKGKPLDEFKHKLGNSWHVADGHHLEKEYQFKDFAGALAFTNRVGAIAEAEGHHPDILLTWGKVRLTIWTHAIDGLSESDFILAAKADEALQQMSL